MSQPEGQPNQDDAQKEKKSGPSQEDSVGQTADTKEDESKKNPEEQKPKKPPIYKRRRFFVGAAIVFVILVIGAIIFWLILRKYVYTDDAYIDGNVVQISPQVAAQVLVLHIDDNVFVRTGDLLIELDPTDYLVALQQAEAQVRQARGQLEQARAQINSSKANVPEAEARERAAEASFANDSINLKRYQLVDERARSRQQLDNSGTTQTNSQAQVDEARAGVVLAKANVVTAEAAEKAAEGALATAEAVEKRAEVNLGYCTIYAPCDGRVTQRTVQAGNYVTAGQALFLLVEPNVWVTANFKETQLTHMKPGQPVTIRVDAFPGKKFQGHVNLIQAGSGSRFAVLPAENATGNYVKIVQRVPVKILFDHGPNTNNAPMLSPGLSVEPWVQIR